VCGAIIAGSGQPFWFFKQGGVIVSRNNDNKTEQPPFLVCFTPVRVKADVQTLIWREAKAAG
jgi:hypothetical protein